MNFLDNIISRMRAWQLVAFFLAVSIALTTAFLMIAGQLILADHLKELLVLGAACTAFVVLMLSPLIGFFSKRTSGYFSKSRDLEDAVSEMEQARQGMELLQRAIDTVPVGVTLSDRVGTIIYTNAAEARIHGYDVYDILGSRASMFAPPDKRRDYTEDELSDFRPWSRDVVNTKKDGSEVPVHLTSDVVSDMDGKPTHLINISEDITERRVNEQKLRDSLSEKEVLLREIHHRVKNNLMIIHSLLSLQLGGIEDEGVRGLLEDSRQRVKAMSLVHEVIYQNEDLSNVDIEAYVRRLTNSLLQTSRPPGKNIKVVTSVDIDTLWLDALIPCGLIINELVSNAFKHAFEGLEEGTVAVELKRDGSNIALCVSDNGRGLPSGFSLESAGTLGMRLVSTLVSQLEGSLKVDSSNGTAFNIMFSENSRGKGA